MAIVSEMRTTNGRLESDMEFQKETSRAIQKVSHSFLFTLLQELEACTRELEKAKLKFDSQTEQLRKWEFRCQETQTALLKNQEELSILRQEREKKKTGLQGEESVVDR